MNRTRAKDEIGNASRIKPTERDVDIFMLAYYIGKKEGMEEAFESAQRILRGEK